MTIILVGRFIIKRMIMELKVTLFYRVQCTLLYIENDAEIFPAFYTWKVAEKGFKMTFMMNKLAMNDSCEILLEKLKKNFCQKSL